MNKKPAEALNRSRNTTRGDKVTLCRILKLGAEVQDL